MQLYFLRHGSAVEPERWRGAEAERPLTDEGRAEMRRVARGLKWLGMAPDAILTSPYTRARETAEMVGAALRVAVTPVEALAPGCDLDGLAAALGTASGSGLPDSVLLVGHEPDLSTLVGLLIGTQGPARVEMKKASCARVEVAVTSISTQALAGRGTLEWLLRAKQIARIGG